MKQNRQDINGILCIDKPQGFTSFDAVAVVRHAAMTRKVGHGGTLDPMATGVLPIFIGRAAKAADLCPVSDKRYIAGFKLGCTSDTGDIWGNVSRCDTPTDVNQEQLTSVLANFTGEIQQIPPMYSAVKINGQRLYSLARQGIEVERPPRQITIHTLKLLSYDSEKCEGTIEVYCSKGTYIRTLIEDIAKELGTGGIMTALQRVNACGFTISQCCDIEQVRNAAPETIKQLLIPVESLFTQYQSVELSDVQRRLFLNGAILDMSKMGLCIPENTLLRIKAKDGQFLGLGVTNSEKGISVKYLNTIINQQ